MTTNRTFRLMQMNLSVDLLFYHKYHIGFCCLHRSTPSHTFTGARFYHMQFTTLSLSISISIGNWLGRSMANRCYWFMIDTRLLRKGKFNDSISRSKSNEKQWNCSSHLSHQLRVRVQWRIVASRLKIVVLVKHLNCRRNTRPMRWINNTTTGDRETTYFVGVFVHTRSLYRMNGKKEVFTYTGTLWLERCCRRLCRWRRRRCRRRAHNEFPLLRYEFKVVQSLCWC